MPVANVNRGTSGVALPTEVSSEIWSHVLDNSAVMQLARRVELPGTGVTIQVITGEPTAAWVAETGVKPKSSHTLATKPMTPYTVAVIEPFSNQFRRDKTALYNTLVERLPNALGKAFDNTVFGGTAVPGSNFDKLNTASAVSLKASTGVWAGLVSADSAVAANDGILNGYVFSPQAKALLLTTVDTTGRPIFVSSVAEGGVPVVLGQPTYIKKAAYTAGTPNVIGWAGDWTQAVYGTVEGVKIAISDQATLTDGENTINLFEQNMFAVRAEIEVGFRVSDVNQFIKFTDQA